MKNTVLRFGLYAGLFMVVVFAVTWLFLENSLSFSAQEVIGYLTIIIPMTFVFWGIRHYRDKINSGIISFGQAMKVGTLIILIPSFLVGISDVFYVQVINPDFMETYYQDSIDRLENTLQEDEFQKRKQEMEAEKEMFSNPFMNFILMFVTVFVIGLIVTVISSLILKRTSYTEPTT